MPIAKVYVPEDTLTPEQRCEIVKGIHEVILTVERVLGCLLLLAVAASPARAGTLAVDTYTADTAGIGVTSTLIYGEHEAILVDAQFRNSDAEQLAARIAAKGRHLKAILITHPHFDHYFGTGILLEHFPGTPVYATQAQIDFIHKTLAPTIARLKPRFGAELPTEVPIPTLLPGTGFTVDGEAVEFVPDQQGDTGPKPANGYVWIPSLATVIAGDIDFNRMHLSTAATNAESRKAWAAALHQIADRHPRVVIAGHKTSPEQCDAPDSLQFNLDYLAAVDPALAASHSAQDYIAEMKRRYPDVGGEVILVNTAGRIFPN